MLWSRVISASALLVAVFGAVSSVGATPVTITDLYGVASDVIGDMAQFDIQKVVFTNLTSTNITAEIYFNYNPGVNNTPGNPGNLGAYNYSGFNLEVGDLLFDVGTTYKYGVILKGRAGFTEGHLYSVTDLYTSNEKLGGTCSGNSPYRCGAFVQVQSGTDVGGAGSVSSVVLAAGPGPDLMTTVSFDPGSSDFWSDLQTSGLSVHFASATCANDVIDGSIPPVPEPATLLLLGTGLVGAGLGGLRRRFSRKA